MRARISRSAPGYRKPIDGATSTRYRSLRDPSKNKGLTRVGLLHGRGMVCPIRSDRYSTPPYNLHGLMTSITLLRASAALRTARVVRSLGHGLRYATPRGCWLSAKPRHTRPCGAHGILAGTRRHTGRRAVYTVAVAARWILPRIPPCILLATRSGIRYARSLVPLLRAVNLASADRDSFVALARFSLHLDEDDIPNVILSPRQDDLGDLLTEINAVLTIFMLIRYNYIR